MERKKRLSVFKNTPTTTKLSGIICFFVIIINIINALVIKQENIKWIIQVFVWVLIAVQFSFIIPALEKRINKNYYKRKLVLDSLLAKQKKIINEEKYNNEMAKFQIEINKDVIIKHKVREELDLYKYIK